MSLQVFLSLVSPSSTVTVLGHLSLTPDTLPASRPSTSQWSPTWGRGGCRAEEMAWQELIYIKDPVTICYQFFLALPNRAEFPGLPQLERTNLYQRSCKRLPQVRISPAQDRRLFIKKCSPLIQIWVSCQEMLVITKQKDICCIQVQHLCIYSSILNL